MHGNRGRCGGSLVLPTATIDAERVCIVWTCPGMLRRAQALKEKVLKLVVDAKQRVVPNEYGIVTLSFLVSSATPIKTWAGPTHTKSVDVHTATQEPFVQALANSESELNMAQVFTEACDLAAKECGLDLPAQVWQLHKDHAKGIEASRRNVFPYARPCDDYAHMRRASYKVLQKYLPGKPRAKARQSGPQCLQIGVVAAPCCLETGISIAACASEVSKEEEQEPKRCFGTREDRCCRLARANACGARR